LPKAAYKLASFSTYYLKLFLPSASEKMTLYRYY